MKRFSESIEKEQVKIKENLEKDLNCKVEEKISISYCLGRMIGSIVAQILLGVAGFVFAYLFMTIQQIL